ncbi:MAG: hypothetical protein RR851_13200 [Clostridium sp.]
MEDGMILPEGFEETTDESTEVTEPIEQQEVQDENQEVQEEVQESQEGAQTEPFIKIKYNKEEVPLTQEQVIELSQKGMNYDKLQERLNFVTNSPGMQYINDLAAKNGMQVDELINHWKSQEEQSQLNELIQNNIPEEYAKEMIENRKFREEQQRVAKEQQQAKAKEETYKRDQADFIKAFPNVEPKDIPENVWESWRGGIPLKFAYMEHEHSQLLNKVKTLETNLNNKNKAPIGMGLSANGSNSAGKEDAFLQGFNSI